MTQTLLTVVLVVGAPQLKDPPPVANPILGRWSAQRIVVGGRDSTKGNEDLEYEFTTDGLWIIYRNGTPLQGSRKYISDRKTKVANIDLTERMDGSAQLGIYQIEAGTMTLSFRTGEGARPVGFDDPPEGLMTLVMTKVKSK